MLAKTISLTIKNYKIAMTSPLKFFEDDDLELYFKIEELGVDVIDSESNGMTNSMFPKSAILFIETSNKIDSIESVSINGNEICFRLTSKYTNRRYIGVGRMQIVLIDGTSRKALPPFEFEIQKVIYDTIGYNGLSNEKGIALLSEDNMLLESVDEVYGIKISELPYTEEIIGIIPIVQHGETRQINISTVLDNVNEKIDIVLDKEIPTLINNNIKQSLREVVIPTIDTKIDEALGASNLSDLIDNKIDSSLDYSNPASPTITDFKSALDYLLHNNTIKEVYNYSVLTEEERENIKEELLTGAFCFVKESGYMYFYNGTKWMKLNDSIDMDMSMYAKLTDLETKSDVGHIHDYSELTSLPEIPSLEGYATEKYVMDILGNIQGGDGNVNIDLELRLKDDLNDTEEPSVKLARAAINSVLNKPTTKEYTITYKYLCDGISIKDEVVETVAAGTVKIFNISNALVIDGYEISSVNPTNATVNNNIVVTYEYIKICIHNYVETITKQPTCTEKGIKTYTCEECGNSYTEEMPMLEHIYVASITKAATCKETGIKTYTCELCGDSYTEEIPKEPHEYVNGICTNCGEHPHEYVETITKQPTCTEKGIKTYTCSLCEDSYTEEIPMLEHTHTSSVTKQPSCTEEGVRTYTCVCGDSYTEVIPMVEHEYVNRICTNCGHELPNEIDITNLFDFTIHPNMIMNTSTITGTSGTWKSSSYFDSAVVDLSAYTGKTIKITIPAYNSSTGKSSCNCTCLVRDTYTVGGTPQLKTILHRWETYSDNTSDKAIGEYREYKIVLPEDTKYFLVSIYNPTALDKCVGSTEFYCKVVLEDEEEIPHTHNYVEVITQQPTCTEEGSKTYTCDECQDSYTEVIPMLGHNYVDGVCTVCGDHVHNYTSVITKQPSCTEEGVRTYTCSGCSDTYTEVIPMMEHEYVNGICTNCGNSEFPIHPTYNEVELTSLFDFTQYPNSLMGSGGSTTINKKTSSYFDSTVIDVSKYTGQKLRIKMPAYTSTSGGSSFGRTCLVNSNGNNPAWVQDLHVYDFSPTGASASGQLIEYVIEIPDNAQYLWTSKFNQAALDKGIGTDDFYCTIYKDIVCTNISLNKTSLSFSDYNNQTLSVSVTPTNTTQKIVWDSSDENVARVENGTITPISNGECIITVSCGTQSATCLIEVNITVSELDITSLFDFTQYPKMIMNTGTETGTSGTWKSSSYFDSATVDVSEYAGKTIKIMIPAYTSSTGKNSANVTCLINSLTGTPTLKTILHRWELSPTGAAASGQMVEYIIQLPSNAQYLLTSIFNTDAINKGIGDTNFHCKVIL